MLDIGVFVENQSTWSVLNIKIQYDTQEEGNIETP